MWLFLALISWAEQPVTVVPVPAVVAVVAASPAQPGWVSADLLVVKQGPLQIELRVGEGEGDVRHQAVLIANAAKSGNLGKSEEVGAGETGTIFAKVDPGEHSVVCRTIGHEAERAAITVVAPYTGRVVGPDDKPSHPTLKVRSQAAVVYPKQAKEAGVADATCRAMLFINKDGTVDEVAFAKCPPMFQPNARKALSEWLFYPPKDKTGRPSTASFVVNVEFKAP